MSSIRDWLSRAAAFERDAKTILGRHESAPSRVVVIEAKYKLLTGLNAKQDELLKQSLRCVEHALYRAAHVMAWAAMMDFLEEKMAADKLKRVRRLRPKWSTSSIQDLREDIAEYHLVAITRDLGLCSKNEVKTLHGMLNDRNECAHPSDFHPGLDEALGYISRILDLIVRLQPRKMKRKVS